MNFQEQITKDARAFITDFGEPIIYNVHNDGSKTIYGVVERNPLARLAEAAEGLVQNIEVYILNDSANGITAINVGKDSVTLSVRYGGTPEKRTITQVVEGDAGLWRLRVR